MAEDIRAAGEGTHVLQQLQCVVHPRSLGQLLQDAMTLLRPALLSVWTIPYVYSLVFNALLYT